MRRQTRISDAVWAVDDQVLFACYPFARRQLLEQGFIDAPGRPVIDIFDRSVRMRRQAYDAYRSVVARQTAEAQAHLVLKKAPRCRGAFFVAKEIVRANDQSILEEIFSTCYRWPRA